MSLLFNTLSRFVNSFSSKEQASFNFMAAITIYSDFGAQENKICHCFHFFKTPSICREVRDENHSTSTSSALLVRAYTWITVILNRLKGLYLIDRVPDELWTEVRDIVQKTGMKTIPKKRNAKNSKMAVRGGLTNSYTGHEHRAGVEQGKKRWKASCG